jgi:hypothetical protein
MPFGRASMSYVTGSHAFKVGFTTYSYFVDQTLKAQNGGVAYNFRNCFTTGCEPVSLIETVNPRLVETRTHPALAIFAQDQWTVRRLTLNLGARFDHLGQYNPASRNPEGPFTPAFDFPRQDNVPNWKDIYPRVGAAFDLFGNGKTAIKGAFGEYLVYLSQTTDIARNIHRANTIVTTATRTWNDGALGAGDPRSGNFAPDCNLSSPVANGECGALSNSGFGQLVAASRFDPDILTGWGKRPTSWQASLSVQHELRPGIGITAGYYRRWYDNFFITQNTAVTRENFASYCVTAPADSRLPDGGGYQVCGINDINPAQFGMVQNLLTKESNLGRQREHYNGFDVNVTARFARNGLISGGASAGQTVSDACDIARAHPEATVPLSIAATPSPYVTGSVDQRPGMSWPLQFCSVTLPFAASVQAKAAVIYPLPWNTDISAVVQNLPGIPILANRAFSNAEIGPSLGRNLAACPPAGACNATVSIPLVSPYTIREDRLTQVDVRLTKTIRVGRANVKGMFDIYNMLNANTILRRNDTYGSTWGRPTAILGARLLKFGAQLDF